MSKLLMSTAAAALVCFAVSRVQADQPSAQTLSDMGLSSLVVMSDVDALTIRGLGYDGHKSRSRDRYDSHKKDRGKKDKGPQSSTKVWGKSSASIDGKKAEADTHNAYQAMGPYSSAGSNFSEAGKEWSETTTNVGPEGTFSVTKSGALRVYAGGSSSAQAL